VDPLHRTRVRGSIKQDPPRTTRGIHKFVRVSIVMALM
jgi:hypothetical protein